MKKLFLVITTLVGFGAFADECSQFDRKPLDLPAKSPILRLNRPMTLTIDGGIISLKRTVGMNTTYFFDSKAAGLVRTDGSKWNCSVIDNPVGCSSLVVDLMTSLNASKMNISDVSKKSQIDCALKTANQLFDNLKTASESEKQSKVNVSADVNLIQTESAK